MTYSTDKNKKKITEAHAHEIKSLFIQYTEFIFKHWCCILLFKSITLSL